MTYPTQKDLLKACREYLNHCQEWGIARILEHWEQIPEYRGIAEKLREELQVGKKSA